ncbi:hypothetical protein SVAN01_01839 [Stagonosporopsis vannaccii]|nr:hypothetical protein SVAN01_01839 [Stagonosporopsis vannaccii]
MLPAPMSSSSPASHPLRLSAPPARPSVAAASERRIPLVPAATAQLHHNNPQQPSLLALRRQPLLHRSAPRQSSDPLPAAAGPWDLIAALDTAAPPHIPQHRAAFCFVDTTLDPSPGRASSPAKAASPAA